MLKPLVLSKVFCNAWTQQNVCKHTDNTATLHALSAGRAVQPMLWACARKVALLATLYNISIHYKYLPSDVLSRLHSSPDAVKTVEGLVQAGATSCGCQSNTLGHLSSSKLSPPPPGAHDTTANLKIAIHVITLHGHA